MIQLVTVLLSFVLTALIGNRLLQDWQLRSWMRQQQFLGQEKEYLSLRDLVDEISSALTARVYRMRRLLGSIASGTDQEVERSRQDYDVVLTAWNEHLTSYYARLILYVSANTATRLEKTIQELLVSTGRQLEDFVRARRAGDKVSRRAIATLDRRLLSAHVTSQNFVRDLLRTVGRRRDRLYYGEELFYTPGDIAKMSTWALVKLLFVSDVDRFSIVGPAQNPQRPG